MAFFALIFGYFFYAYAAIFVRQGIESQMMGRGADRWTSTSG